MNVVFCHTDLCHIDSRFLCSLRQSLMKSHVKFLYRHADLRHVDSRFVCSLLQSVVLIHTVIQLMEAQIQMLWNKTSFPMWYHSWRKQLLLEQGNWRKDDKDKDVLWFPGTTASVSYNLQWPHQSDVRKQPKSVSDTIDSHQHCKSMPNTSFGSASRQMSQIEVMEHMDKRVPMITMCDI